MRRDDSYLLDMLVAARKAARFADGTGQCQVITVSEQPVLIPQLETLVPPETE